MGHKTNNIKSVKELSVVLLVIIVGCPICGGLTFTENGYDDLLIAINPEIPEDPTLIDSLKNIWTEASESLFVATGKRAYFRSVKILVPESWDNGAYDSASNGETYISAGVLVANPNPQYGNIPYTLQYGGCGQPGEYIHLTADFIKNDSFIDDFGPKGKVLVHEWAHLQWGVFDEGPTDGYSNFYIDNNGDVAATKCSSEMEGDNKVVNFVTSSARDCEYEPGALLPEFGCVFLPKHNQPAGLTASIMSHQYVDAISTFCHDNRSDPNNLHNSLAPNEQNRLCNLRSTMDVILDSDDFSDGKNSANESINDTTPSFTILRASPTRFALVLDVSGSMRSNGRLQAMQNAAGLFVTDYVANSSYVGLVSFEENATKLSDLKSMGELSSRTHLNELIQATAAGGSTGIGSGILKGLEVLRGPSGEFGCDGNLIVLTDGQENQYPYVNDVFDEVISCGARVLTIFLDLSNQANQDLANLSESSGGLYDSTSSSSSNFIGIFQSFSQSDNGDDTHTTYQIYSSSHDPLPANTETRGEFTIDSTIGEHTLFTVNWGGSQPAAISLQSPDGCEYSTVTVSNACADAPIHSCSATQRSCIFTVPGVAQTGRWLYTILNSATAQSLSVIVTSRSSHSDIQPIIVQSFLEVTQITSTAPIKVYARVSQGHAPVLDANVTAVITTPSKVDISLQLLDGGAGADIRQNDGIYSKYFYQYSDVGRYSMQILVNGNLPDVSSASIVSSAAFNFGTISDDGTFVANPNGLTNLPNNTRVNDTSEIFERVTSGGSFSYSGPDLSTGDDVFPPTAVTDLRVIQVNYSDSENRFIVHMQFSATGDDVDSGTASRYEFRFSQDSAAQLVNAFNNSVLLNQSNLIQGNTSQPLEASSTENFIFAIPSPGGVDSSQIYIAVVAYDDVEFQSSVSNIATTTLARSVVGPVTEGPGDPVPDQIPGPSNDWIAGVAVGVVVFILAVASTTVFFINKSSNSAKIENFEGQSTTALQPV